MPTNHCVYQVLAGTRQQFSDNYSALSRTWSLLRRPQEW